MRIHLRSNEKEQKETIENKVEMFAFEYFLTIRTIGRTIELPNCYSGCERKQNYSCFTWRMVIAVKEGKKLIKSWRNGKDWKGCMPTQGTDMLTRRKKRLINYDINADTCRKRYTRVRVHASTLTPHNIHTTHLPKTTEATLCCKTKKKNKNHVLALKESCVFK